MLGRNEGRKRRGQQRVRWLDDSINSKDMNLGKLWETSSLVCCSPWGHKESD